MPHENAHIDEARNWFNKAEMDLRTASIIFDNDRSLEGIVLFHCQQAVEKSLKGFLAYNNISFRKTHHIGELGHQCIQIEPSFEPSLRSAFKLTVYAWAFRYPEEPEEPVSGDAASAMLMARGVYEMVLSKLPADVRPHPT
jgi:HEPN domain-containing protein